MLSHDSLYLLRNVLTAPRLMYLLRTAPCTGSPELLKFDAVLRESVSTTLNIDLGYDHWTQASLPVRLGGLGIHSVISLAPSAYLASAVSTEELTTSLLLSRMHGAVDSDIATAKSAWSQLATSPSTTSIAPSPAWAVQRVWDNQCCEFQADQLLDAAVDDDKRARYLVSRAPGSGDWLHTLPLSSIGLKMDNATVRIAVGLRLGAPIMRFPNTYAQSYVQANSRKAGSAAIGADLKKLHKYQDISAGVDFIPFAIESSSIWGHHALELVSEIGRRLSEVSHEPRSTSFLCQRLAVAVPPALLGHCRSTAQWTSCSLTVFVATLIILIIIIIIITTIIVCNIYCNSASELCQASVSFLFAYIIQLKLSIIIIII